MFIICPVANLIHLKMPCFVSFWFYFLSQMIIWLLIFLLLISLDVVLRYFHEYQLSAISWYFMLAFFIMDDTNDTNTCCCHLWFAVCIFRWVNASHEHVGDISWTQTGCYKQGKWPYCILYPALCSIGLAACWVYIYIDQMYLALFLFSYLNCVYQCLMKHLWWLV